jgi:hypothetical protein
MIPYIIYNKEAQMASPHPCRSYLLLFALLVLLALMAGCSADKSVADTKDTEPESYQTLDWVELMPQADLDALLKPPAYLDDIADGSAEDQLSSELQAPSGIEKDSPYYQALTSTKVRAEFNHRPIRIPGFIVPLTFNDQQVVTTFFLVPFFGACIHQPPPPPNQIIYGEYEPGKKLENLYEAFWIEGILSTQLIENDMATAAYSMQVKTIKPYEYN